MKTQQEYIEQGEQYILKTYNRFQVVLEEYPERKRPVTQDKPEVPQPAV